MSNTDKIEINEISKNFYKKSGNKFQCVEALKGINFSVRKDEFMTVVGPSGCGKTTLLRIIDGLIKPDTGTVLIDGNPITGPGEDRSVVFQNFGLMPWKNVLDNVKFALLLRKPELKEQHNEIARKYINIVGLAGFENHYPHELSGGMQQRVGFARALSIDPDILLMDEPLASVDAQTREILQEELLKIWGRNKKTVLFITHSIDEAVLLADRILVLDARPGKVRTIISNDMPHPRWMYPVRKDPKFAELREEVWGMIRTSYRDYSENGNKPAL
ncbi:MAG TPA: ABC transporter ATP-binding protein [Candidatus Marinimicrobia bacterium]|jgi:NitT/TauT family transport system ATP-binding protein|nr:ABC transporter ATP-binding protein [Candidatus Neomarinimicrobiota bacterium]